MFSLIRQAATRGGFLLVLLLVTRSVFSEQHFIPDWKSNCNLNNKTFSIIFHSKSGHAEQDDMEVNLTLDKQTVQLPLPPGLYVRRGVVSDSKNLCEDIGAFSLSDNKVLLWLSSDQRPGWDSLNLVLLDLPTEKTLDHKEGIGLIKDPGGHQRLAIRGHNGNYEVRLEREWLKNTGTDSAENSIEDWMSVNIVDNKILTKWSK